VGCSHGKLLFTENETNYKLVFDTSNSSPYVKDGINNYVVNGAKTAVNPNLVGTKASINYVLSIEPGATQTIQLRLSDLHPTEFGLDLLVNNPNSSSPFQNFDAILAIRKQEADEFYQRVTPFSLSEDMRNVQRQAFAGMLWCKQYYHYIVEDWLQGDANVPIPPPQRKRGRNRAWFHLYTDDILSMIPCYLPWEP
jgi:hypothetical protein